MEVEQTFGVTLPAANYNKLMAAIELVTSDSFYVNLPSFIRLCNTLYNGTFDPRMFDPADAGEVAWGITEATLLWPAELPENPFDDKIVQYIQHVLRDEGIMNPPDVLKQSTIDTATLDAVQADFSDDPAMFTAIFERDRDKTDTINKLVKDRLLVILTQLDSLELLNGDPTDAVKKMLAHLQTTQRKGQEMQKAGPPE